MKTGDISILEHIIAYCNEIDHTISIMGNSYEAFESNSIYRNAVAMCLLQIGELVSNLSTEYKEATKGTIYWSGIKALRNICAHAYGSIDIPREWDIVKK